jgi:hypothetical protein
VHAITPVTTSSICDVAVDLCQLITLTTSTTNHDAPHLLASNARYAPRKHDKHHNHHHDNHQHHCHASKWRKRRLKQTAGVQGTPPFHFYLFYDQTNTIFTETIADVFKHVGGNCLVTKHHLCLPPPSVARSAIGGHPQSPYLPPPPLLKTRAGGVLLATQDLCLPPPPPSLETRAEGCFLSPTASLPATTPSITRNASGGVLFVTHSIPACHHPLRRSKHEQRGSSCHPQSLCLPPPPPSLETRAEGSFF